MKKSKKFWVTGAYEVDRQVDSFLVELFREVLVEAEDVLHVVSEEGLVVDGGEEREFFLLFFGDIEREGAAELVGVCHAREDAG